MRGEGGGSSSFSFDGKTAESDVKTKLKISQNWLRNATNCNSNTCILQK